MVRLRLSTTTRQVAPSRSLELFQVLVRKAAFALTSFRPRFTSARQIVAPTFAFHYVPSNGLAGVPSRSLEHYLDLKLGSPPSLWRARSRQPSLYTTFQAVVWLACRAVAWNIFQFWNKWPAFALRASDFVSLRRDKSSRQPSLYTTFQAVVWLACRAVAWNIFQFWNKWPAFALRATSRQPSLYTTFQAKAGGGGGSRTRVRKHSTRASTYLSWTLNFAPQDSFRQDSWRASLLKFRRFRHRQPEATIPLVDALIRSAGLTWQDTGYLCSQSIFIIICDYV